MGFFKKILKSVSSDESTQSILVHRPPRVHLHPLHRVFFTAQGLDKPLDVANISVGGMAVFHHDNPELKAGRTLNGTIAIDKDHFEVEARIRHIQGVVAGCQFNSMGPMGSPNDEYIRLKRAVENYFRLEILALNLYPVAPGFMKHDPRGATHWVTDGRQNEVYAVTDAQGLVAFNLSFLGHYVEGSRDGALHAGLIHEQPHRNSPGHKQASMLDISGRPSDETVRLALGFVQNAVRLPLEIRKSIESYLAQALTPTSAAE